MTAPDDDVVERGRAIFEQLRRPPAGATATDLADGPLPEADSQDPVIAGEDGVSEGAGREGAKAGSPASDDGPGGEGAIVDAGNGGAMPEAEEDPAPAPDPPPAADPAPAAESAPAADPGPAPDPTPPAPDPPPAASVASPVDAAPRRPLPGPVPLGVPPEASVLLDARPEVALDPASLSPTRFARDLPRVMAIANQKGGVGKTTTAVNLGAGLAELGYRVLVVDLDPQGNATTGLGINPRNLESSVYDVMMHDVPLDDCVEPTSLRNLFVCPATIDLAGAEIELVPAFSRELKLRRALEPVLEDFDFVVIDCPPSLGLITINALAAASEVVVPIQCEYYALEGLGQLLRNVNLVQTNLNPRLEVSAIVLTMFDARTKLAEQVAAEVRTHFGAKVCRNIVPRTVRLSEAPSFGQPIIVFDPTSRGAIAYRELAKEVSGGASQRVG